MIKEHNSIWSQIPDHPYIILLIGGSGSAKVNSLFNLICHQPDIDIYIEICLYVRDPFEEMYQMLINKRENTDLKHFNDSKAFIKFLNDLDVTYKNIEEYNPNEKCKILIEFYDMIADMLRDIKLTPIVTE